MSVRYRYRVSEGVILRQPDAADAWKLEAWSEKEGKWFVYSWIDKDWQTASRPMDERDVPPEARLAPSSYRDGWTRRSSAARPTGRTA